MKAATTTRLIPGRRGRTATVTVFALALTLFVSQAAWAWTATGATLYYNVTSWQVRGQSSTDAVLLNASHCGGQKYHSVVVYTSWTNTTRTSSKLQSVRVKNNEPISLTVDYFEIASKTGFKHSGYPVKIGPGQVKELTPNSLPKYLSIHQDAIHWVMDAQATNRADPGCRSNHTGRIVMKKK